MSTGLKVIISVEGFMAEGSRLPFMGLKVLH